MSFTLPDPDLQILFSQRVVAARKQFMQPALLEAVRKCSIEDLDRDAHKYVPVPALQQIAGHGFRAEIVFALPTLLRHNPRLLAYYRLFLGYSQKLFYGSGTGLSGFKSLEEGASLTEEQNDAIPDVCAVLNQAVALLVWGIRDDITIQHVSDLSLLTYGPQLRGGRNVLIGQEAIRQVFESVQSLIGGHATKVTKRYINFTDSTGRSMQVVFSSDPDIAVFSVSARPPHIKAPVLAIEVKGGADYSNAGNRLGEAEKSHVKAKARGFTDLWTIVNVVGLSEERRRAESPTTTAFFDLMDVIAREGNAYEDFRERFLQKLRLPGA